MASSLITAAVMSLLFFTIGFLCRHFCRKERKMAGTVSSPVGQTQIPYYDDVVLKQELELKANVALWSSAIIVISTFCCTHCDSHNALL